MHAVGREASARGSSPQAAIPEEIAFLAAHGAPVAALIEAAAMARRCAVAPAAALLAGDEVGELAYYTALARRLGVPFVGAPPPFAGASPPLAGAPAAWMADGHRLLIAPEGRALRDLLAMRKVGRSPLHRLAITTPRRLAAWTRAAAARRTARAASDDLRRFDAALSARTDTPAGLRLALAAALLFSGGALACGGLPFAVLCGVIGLATGGVVAFRLCATAATIGLPAPRTPWLSDAALPTYTILAPLYREARVAERLVANIKNLDYPPAKIEVKWLVEADDHETRAAIEALDLPARFETVIAPPGAPRTKPRALNVGLQTAKGSLIVVFDAEDDPEPQQLRLAAARFAGAGPDLACLQARLAIDNTQDSWLSALFGIEYAALFDVFNPGLAALAAPMMLGGTSNHFRGIR